MISFRASALACALVLFAGYGSAATLTVNSYTYNTPPVDPYTDETGTQLIDTVLGPVNLAGSGNIPWVGAWPGAASITFNVSAQTIDSVAINFLHSSGQFVSLPSGVVINGQTFTPDGNAVANGETGFVTFNLSPILNTQTVNVTLNSPSFGGILIDEVQFTGTPASTASGAPEPATVSLVGTGAVVCGLAARRRRRLTRL